MATKNIEQFAPPKESAYSKRNAEVYYQDIDKEVALEYEILGKDETAESRYDGTKIPEEELSESTKESIERIKKKDVKLGMKGLRAAMFLDDAA